MGTLARHNVALFPTHSLSVSSDGTELGAVTVLGDVNADGEVGFDDIPPLVDVLVSGSFQAAADCNQDGVCDFADIPPFVSTLTGQ